MRQGIWRSVVMGALGSACLAAPARAESESRRFLFFSGTDVSTVSGFAWSGAEAALRPSRDVSGPIFRVMGGAGRYDYAKDGAPDGKVIGDVMTGEVLAGWRQIGTALCVSVLGGFAIEDHNLDVDDPDNEVQGTESGAKVMAELFWRPSDRTYIDASATYAAPFDFWRVRLAGGYEVWRGISIGPEFEAFGNRGSEQVRAGLGVSDIKWRAWRMKGSAGALYDWDDWGMYGRLGVEKVF